MDLPNPMSSAVPNDLLARRQKAEIPVSMSEALRTHWPEYLMEAAGLGLFMISACAFTVLLNHPLSPAVKSLPGDGIRRVLMGLAMGSTAVAIIFSPFGKRSGAHINPAVTLTFFRLGKIAPGDAAFYTLSQFAGAVLGVILASLSLGSWLANEGVNYAITTPGPRGNAPAFLAEVVISFILMLVILTVSNTKRFGRWTGLFAGALIATYISLESPLSGMSMNPARTFGSAAVAQVWTSIWIYFTAPPIGMLLAAEVYKRLKAGAGVACAKLHHHNNHRCIFRCNFEG